MASPPGVEKTACRALAKTLIVAAHAFRSCVNRFFNRAKAAGSLRLVSSNRQQMASTSLNATVIPPPVSG